MTYNVEFQAQAVVGLELLTLTIQERILRKIRWLAENFDNVSPQALSADLSSFFKLRVGDYRIIYSYNTETQLITIHKVGHRQDIYS